MSLSALSGLSGLSGIAGTATAEEWAEQMLASYRALNPEQAPWFDGAGAFAQTELQTRLAPGGYLNDTFGPSGQNKSVCDFVYLLYTTGNIASRTIAKSGATIRWNIDGTIYNQNNLPAHTKGAGAGIATLSSTDGWSGVTGFRVNNNSFSGNCPNLAFPNVTVFNSSDNSFSGNCPNFAFPNVTTFFIYNNSFSGNCPLFVFPNVTNFRIYDNSFSGNCPLFVFPNVTDFQIYNNSFSGNCPLFVFPNVAIFRIFSNSFSGDCPLFVFPDVTDFQIYTNSFSGNCPLFVFPNVTIFRIYNNSFSGNCPLFVFPNVTDFQIYNNSFSGNCPLFVFPNVIIFRIYNNSFSGIAAGTISFVEGTSNLKSIQAQGNNLPQADIDRLLAAYHPHRAYYAGLAGNLVFSLSGAGNATPSATGITHRQEIIDAFVAAGKTATITINEEAWAFISAVEAADGQALEAGIRNAFIDFVDGCRTDGIWDAIKACCIMAGTRTVAGALVPLKGSAPTNFNFVTEDYNRKTGLKGDGSTKYLNSNRAGNADPQNNAHLSIFVSSDLDNFPKIGATDGATFNNRISNTFRVRTSSDVTIAGYPALGFAGASRINSTQMIARGNGTTVTESRTSATPPGNSTLVFGQTASSSSSRLSFYSIGEGLTSTQIASLDSRVTALMTAIDNAI